MSGRLARLDRAGQLDRPTEKQQFFGQGCLAGVRVTNDAEGAPAIDFFTVIVAHFKTSGLTLNGSDEKKTGHGGPMDNE
jgi:hypothetical protein